MTTIDHQQAATVAAAKALFVMQHRVAVEKFELNSYAALSEAATREASNALQAAAPHLRAAWEQPIRGICEQAIQDKEDSLCRMFNGEPFPAMIPATAVLDLLEGGAE